MAIETTLQRRMAWKFPLLTVLCIGFALWGAYDYFVTIPQREEAVARYASAASTRAQLEALPPPLSAEQQAEYTAAGVIIDRFKGEKPVPPAAYDRPVQLWLYMVGCGVIGVPWMIWSWVSTARCRYRLDDDGTLHYPGGQVGLEDIADIDMSRWMSKSIATVKTTDGRAITLDDYKYKNIDRIVGTIAQSFYPEDWTEDARDRRKLEAEAAEAETHEGSGTG